MPSHVLSDVVLSPHPHPQPQPTGYGWSVTDFWSWDVQYARLHCPDENDGGMKGESEVPRGP